MTCRCWISETLTLRDLLAMAMPVDVQRWHALPLGYGDPRGAVWLRQAISETYADANEDTVLCFAGAQDAMTCVAQALLSPRDHAIVVVPCYPPSEATVTLAAPCTGVALDAEYGWSLDLDRIAAAIQPTTRMVVTNFPNNPTGAMIAWHEFNALITLCRRHRLWLVNDEVYRLIDRDPAARPPQVAEVYERGVSINGLSKSFGLPGLRIGWVACRDKVALECMAMVRNVVRRPHGEFRGAGAYRPARTGPDPDTQPRDRRGQSAAVAAVHGAIRGLVRLG